MITKEEAYSIALKNSGTKNISVMLDYDSDHFVFGLDTTKQDAVSYYIAVDKNTGNVTNFIIDDFVEFFDAAENRSIDISQFKHNDASDYLEHHGILGMKWGVRRYQNKDGSLTAEGKERYVRSFKGVKQPFYYNLPDNKKDKRLVDIFRYNITKKMSREDWDKLYKGTKEDHYAIAEKIAKQMLGEELFSTKMQDISDLSKLQTYGEFEINRLLPDYSEE